MPLIQYEDWRPSRASLAVVHAANQIIEEYAAQGFDLTLRQLYYQFVSRDLIPNRQSEYKKLGETISRARRAGRVDWDAIVDRTRRLQSLSTWPSPARIVEVAAQGYRRDLWAGQPYYVEVWFEKDALMGVFEGPANSRRVPFFSCRGYASDSEVWRAAQRFIDQRDEGADECVILHFGDHDPSGLDMTRDIEDRLALFGAEVDVRRIALNMDQIREYEPPPNPAKSTDSRFADYVRQYGRQSWELDALEPSVLATLIESEVDALVDHGLWAERLDEEEAERAQLREISDRFPAIVDWLTNEE